jgi:hypothetical protein
MEKHFYTIKWTQPYTSWPSAEWIDEAQAAILESMLDQKGLTEANQLIERIKNASKSN